MKRFGTSMLLAAGLGLGLLPSRARAEGDEPVVNGDSAARASADSRIAYAEYLFQEGVKLMKSDNCPLAISKFLSSQRLDSSPATLMNLATCYARLGRTASASRTYQRAATAAASEGSDGLRDRAFKAISVLAPTLTKLKIVPPRGLNRLDLTLNGEHLTVDDELPVPLDPGENVIEASAPGRQPWRHTVNGDELGATIVIEVPQLSSAAAPERRNDWRTAAVIVGGAGAASIVVGSILGLSAKATYDESRSNCRDGYCNATGLGLRDDADRKATLSNYAVAAGALLAATGIVLWFAAPSRAEHAVGIVPWLHGPDALPGLAIRGQL